MSSQRIITRIFLSAVALVLLLFLSIRIISASPAEAKEAALPQEEADQRQLLQQIAELTELVKELSNQDVCYLIIRMEQTVLGESVTLDNRILTIAVDRRFYDSCNRDDEVTDSPWVQNLSEPIIGEVRLFVVDKYTVPR